MMSRGTKRHLMIAGVVAMLVAVAVPILRHTLGLAARLDPAEAAVPATTGSVQADVKRAPAPVVTVTAVRTREVVESLFVCGTLTARDEVMIGVQLDGLRVVEILAEEGDRVAKGQVLARLDRSQLDALLAQNGAALKRSDAAIAQATSQIAQVDAVRGQANADLARARKLDVTIITQATLDQRVAAARSAEAQFAAATSALAIAEADKASREAERRELMVRIGRTDVVTPVAGVVSRRTARLGAMAMWAGEALFRVIAEGAIDLDADVPEDRLARLAVGMRARLELPGSAQRVEGSVRLIATEVDRATRLGKVRIALPADLPARIGSFASGTIELARREVVVVPASAVLRSENSASVMVVRHERVALAAVEPGVTDAGFVEIRKGLVAGDTVVAQAAAFLRDGDAVRAIHMADAKAAAQ
jgi:HlyD family secretion protein